MTDLDHTHDPALQSWVESANRPGRAFDVPQDGSLPIVYQNDGVIMWVSELWSLAGPSASMRNWGLP